MPDPGPGGVLSLSAEVLSRLACPACRGGLVLDAGAIRCLQCQRRYPIQDGIPVLIAARAVASGTENR